MNLWGLVNNLLNIKLFLLSHKFLITTHGNSPAAVSKIECIFFINWSISSIWLDYFWQPDNAQISDEAAQFHIKLITVSSSTDQIRHRPFSAIFLSLNFSFAGRELVQALHKKFFTLFGTRRFHSSFQIESRLLP